MCKLKSIYINELTVFAGCLIGLLFVGCLESVSGPVASKAVPSKNTTSVDDPNGVFYPPAPEIPRLQFLKSFSDSNDLGPSLGKKAGRFERFVLGDKDNMVRGIAKPYGIAMDDGKLYICDVQTRVVEILDLKAREFGYLDAERRMSSPVNLCVENGTKYITDSVSGKIFVYGPDNELEQVFGDGLDLKPIDVAVRGKRCYVTDMKQNQVVVLDAITGGVITRFGKAGDQLGQFVLIGDLALDAQENLYVTDKLLGRVTKFNREGIFQKAFGKADKSVHQFVRPKGIAVDRENRIWVVDAAPEVTKVYSPEGQLLLYFGFPGSTPGSMNMPASIEIDYDHVSLFEEHWDKDAQIEFIVWVSNQYGEKINVYAYGRFPRQEAARDAAQQALVVRRQQRLTVPDPSVELDLTPPTPERAIDTIPSQDTPQQEQVIADMYYRSMHLYRNDRFLEAREGFVTVLNSGMIPSPMATTIQNYLQEIARRHEARQVHMAK
jgi:DNA-binding beta-propeller fold protein YncE